jgi:hypothetical protein
MSALAPGEGSALFYFRQRECLRLIFLRVIGQIKAGVRYSWSGVCNQDISLLLPNSTEILRICQGQSFGILPEGLIVICV